MKYLLKLLTNKFCTCNSFHGKKQKQGDHMHFFYNMLVIIVKAETQSSAKGMRIYAVTISISH